MGSATAAQSHTALIRVDRSAEQEEWEWAATRNHYENKHQNLRDGRRHSSPRHLYPDGPPSDTLNDLLERVKRREAREAGIEFLGPM